MLTKDLRRQFLKYFKQQQHSIVPSSPVVPHDDPTLLFTNAGMNQFKDVFLGNTVRDYTRAVTSQKCIRAGGKHNDLENVGHTRRHLTFFEMLGNFSFGDYFKADAIKFAWEVSTNIFGFDPNRIWPTVFYKDEEAFELWTNYVLPSRITRFDEKSNFWAMGDTGPCGPCSELLYDRGPKYGDAQNPTADIHETRYLEFWNLVFMQYNRDEKGKEHPLPKPSIDTGAGLERIVNLKMEVDSIYDTDILRSLIAQIEEISGISYPADESHKAAAFRVIADHLRCLSFAIADGAQPSNIDRGYVLRKILRRAVRYGRLLRMEKPFLAELLPRLINTMGEDYPELIKSQTRIEEVLTEEEESFFRTLRKGGNILNQIIEQAKAGKISGDEAFKLKDTYGLPLEEILLLAKDADLRVDIDRYNELEQEAKERSRRVHKTTKQVASENLFATYLKEYGESTFFGYTEQVMEGKITAIVVDGQFVKQISKNTEGLIILDTTPFYAEKGGQAGDTGTLHAQGVLFEVKDCQSPYKGVIAHIGKICEGSLQLGDTVTAAINNERRQKIANNHTATHLLHWALCQVLGDHVKQGGSVVEPGRLRFDFCHHKALTIEEINQIEDLVNEKIRGNLPVVAYELPYEEAQHRHDIKQFFGEKYGSQVRVIDIDYSKELCGGTHTSALGNIGLFRIAKEGSIAAGIRRIEAVTGKEAEILSRESENLLNNLAEYFKTSPSKVSLRVQKLLEENKALTQEIKTVKQSQMNAALNTLLSKVEKVHGIPTLIAHLSSAIEEVRPLADEAINTLKSGVLILGAGEGNKCLIIARVSDDIINKGIKADEIIKAIAPIIEGGGGGKAESAQAGGKAPHKIDEALAAAKQLIIDL
jgi:alanyl-tRNA synthetase